MTELNLPKKTLAGFGNYISAEQVVYRAERIKDLGLSLQQGKNISLLPRGFGKSYGDAALNSKGQVVLMERMNRFLAFDHQTLILKSEAGASVLDVIKTFGPLGYTLPVTPGASHITLGGCAAFDIHSKNHWLVGGFGESVRSMTLVLADGKVVECSREKQPDLFFATLGGMGLTGFILELDIQLVPLRGTKVENTSSPFSGITNLVQDFLSATKKSEYVVAWLDLLNSKHVTGFVISSEVKNTPLAELSEWSELVPPPLKLIAPFFSHFTNRLFNWAFSLKHKLSPKVLIPLRSFLFPWDALSNWNMLYGKKGFVEYQCCVPMANAEESLTKITNYIIQNRSKFPAYFAAVKRMKQGTGLLSFPIDGFSLLMDFPVRDGLWSFLEGLDQIVLDCGGKVYLAKDGRLSAEMFKKMYPNLERWKKVRMSVDPAGRFTSDMSRRLKLEEP